MPFLGDLHGFFCFWEVACFAFGKYLLLVSLGAAEHLTVGGFYGRAQRLARKASRQAVAPVDRLRVGVQALHRVAPKGRKTVLWYFRHTVEGHHGGSEGQLVGAWW